VALASLPSQKSSHGCHVDAIESMKLTFSICKSHNCDIAQIGYPHSNPHHPVWTQT